MCNLGSILGSLSGNLFGAATDTSAKKIAAAQAAAEKKRADEAAALAKEEEMKRKKKKELRVPVDVVLGGAQDGSLGA